MKRITIETAKLAKEVGYEKSDFYWANYYIGFPINKWKRIQAIDANKIPSMEFPAPYQAELQEWLRNEHNIIVTVGYSIYYELPWYVTIQKITDLDWIEEPCDFDSYEDALEAGLVEALKILKNENT